MSKPYCAFLIFISLLGWGNVFAQAPVISYSGPVTDTVGKVITPISPKNSGGAIPAGFYTQTSSLAGTGLYGATNGKKSAASFGAPLGICKDASGNIYLADANNNMIRKITPAGVVSTYAGNGAKGFADGPAASASFNYPTGVACDPQGNVYVADYTNHRIRKITTSGTVSTLAGSGVATYGDGTGATANFNLPYGLVYDALTGNLIVADSYNNMIRQVTLAGVVTTIAGKPGSGGYVDGSSADAMFYVPYAVAVDAAGVIYVADAFNNKLRKIDNSGTVSTVSSSSLVGSQPRGIAIDSHNNVYLTSLTPVITKFSPTGQASVLAGNLTDSGRVDGIGTAARFGTHTGIMYDATTGSLLIADGDNRMIRKISLTGYDAISPALPHGLKMDSTGTIIGTPDTLSPATNYRIVGYNKTDSAVATVNIRVIQAQGIISFPDFPVKTYGDSSFVAGAIATDPDNVITYTSGNTKVAVISGDTIKIVGAGTAIITATQQPNAKYITALPISHTLTVNKASLTVTANDESKLSGDINPPLALSYKTFAYKDTPKSLLNPPTAVTTATQSSADGTYPITVSGGTDPDYNFVYVSGKLTVQSAPKIIASGPTAFIKGGSVVLTANPDTGYTYQWAVNGKPIQGATKDTYTAINSGNYTVALSLNSHTVTSAPDTVVAAFKLSPQNFQLLISGTTCQGSNNGSIHVTALQSLRYTATINGNGISAAYRFSDSLTVNNMGPGLYDVCFTVDSEAYQQCFNVNISQPQDLSVYSTVNKNAQTLSLQLSGSATAYNIKLNNKTYTTTDSTITLPLEKGDNQLTVTTDKACQGSIEKNIIVSDNVAAYPNPFQDILNVNLGNQIIRNVAYNVYSVTNGKLVYSGQNANQSGLLRLDLSNIADGLYYLKLDLDTKKSSFKIIKK